MVEIHIRYKRNSTFIPLLVNIKTKIIMKKITIIILLKLFAFNSYGQDFIEPTLKESFALNNHTNRDVSYFSVIDSNENIISIATTERDSSFTDILTTKLDSNLNQIWQKRFSKDTNLSYDIPLNSLIDTNNNLYIIGRSSTNQSSANGLLFVVKYDTNGNEVWNLNMDDYNNSNSDDYFYQNSFLDSNGFLHIIHVKSNESNTAAKFHFYKIDTSGVIIESFSREDVVDTFNNNFTGMSYEVFFRNNEYYLRYRRHNLTSNPTFYEHFIKKINNTTIETYPLNSIIDLNDTDFFYKGIIEVDSNSSIYLTYPLESSNKFKLLKLDNLGNLIYSIESPDNYDKDTFAVNINSNGNLSILCNSKLSSSAESKTLNLLEYDDSGNIIIDLNASSTFINGLKYYSDNSILVYSNGNFKLFDQSLNLTNEFLGPYNNFNDFNLINNSNIAISRTTFSQMYSGSDFATQQDIEIQKINVNQILNIYNYSGEGTSKAYQQSIILDNNNNALIISEEKLGPDELAIGGSRAPVRKSVYKYDTNLNLLWNIEIPYSIIDIYYSGDKNYVIDSNNNLYINTRVNASTFELIKISENGNILFQIPSYRSRNIHLDENDNLILVSSPINSSSFGDSDTYIYTFNSSDGSIINTVLLEGVDFLDSFKSQNNDSYLYMYSKVNSTRQLHIYKNLNLEFITNLNIPSSGIWGHDIDSNGTINFSSPNKLHSLTLTNQYNNVNVSGTIRQVVNLTNSKIFTLNNNGYVNVFNNDLTLFSSSTASYYDQPYLLEINNTVFFNTYWDNVVKVFDENSTEISTFKLPSSLSYSVVDLDSNNSLLLTGGFGEQISINQEYSWRRGLIHKYDFSSFNLSIDENYLIKDSLTIYPNPTNSIITINSIDNSISRVSIYDINGRFLFQTKSSKIDISHLPTSIYLLKIVLQNGNTLNRKIVKK